MNERCDIAIVGAGAAGLAAGIFAAEAARAAGRTPRILLLDGAAKIGAKILISGGGRCNVTHDAVRPEDFFGSPGSRVIIRNVLAAFDEQATVRWFASLGVRLKREPGGKLFPVSDRAVTVLDALVGRCRTLGVEILPGHRVKDVRTAAPANGPGTAAAGRPDETRPPAVQVNGMDRAASDPEKTAAPESSRFVIVHERGELAAGRVIMATGGRSLPRTGSDGGGWKIAGRLGHTLTQIICPALVPLVLGEPMFHAALSGLAQPAELSTLADGRPVDRRSGSLLWTHFGISGPVVMDASRHWLLAKEGAGGEDTVELRCNLLPGRDFEQVDRDLIERARESPRAATGKTLAGWLPERLSAALVRHAGLDPARPLGQLTREQRRTLVHALTALLLPVLRDRGWNYAEATAGGVPLTEIDYRTMQSRRTPGLYLAGEMLDCDGRIGGFNFQWAWATGYLAGRGAARADEA